MIALRHLLVPLDATGHDRRALDVATATAIGTGARVTLLLPRTARVLDSLRGFADSENLTLPDAGEVYVNHAATLLRDWDVPVGAVSLPSADAARDIALYAERHDVTLVLLVASGEPHRRGLRGPVAARVVRLSTVPVLVLPPAEQSTSAPADQAA